ncbi:MAG: hypothetical protein ACXAD7_13385, partial [Candidatus Kariarchaeaceae archaeon]
MPHELKEIDEITESLLNRTIVAYSKRSGEYVKFKLRTKKTLYTIKASPDEASAIENKINSSGHSI